MARPIEIDAAELVDAMMRGPDWEASLDPETGNVDPSIADDPDRAEEPADGAGGLDVPRIDGRTMYGWMAAFAAGLDEDDVRRELEVALDGAGAFGRLRRAIDAHPDLRAAWFDFRDERVLAEAREWLEAEGFAPTFRRPPPRPTPAAAPPAQRRVGLHDVLLLGDRTAGPSCWRAACSASSWPRPRPRRAPSSSRSLATCAKPTASRGETASSKAATTTRRAASA